MDAIRSKGIEGLLQLTKEDVTPEFAVHAWLIVFMTGVGLLKASGKLPHLNSRTVGLLELVGGLVFLPGWPQLLEATKLHIKMSYLIGCLFIMSGLGMVIADPKKRVSPVCWIHAGLTLLFIHQQKLPEVLLMNNPVPAVFIAGAFLVYGIILGAVRNSSSSESGSKDKSA